MVKSRSDRSENAHIIRQEQACNLLGGREEPTVRALMSRAAFLRRTRKGSEASALEVLVSILESIAVSAGV